VPAFHRRIADRQVAEVRSVYLRREPPRGTLDLQSSSRTAFTQKPIRMRRFTPRCPEAAATGRDRAWVSAGAEAAMEAPVPASAAVGSEVEVVRGHDELLFTCPGQNLVVRGGRCDDSTSGPPSSREELHRSCVTAI
jgi:hypothetical protein